MDLQQARAFARHNHHAVLTTRTGGDGLQQSPVLVAVDDDGLFVVSSRETAYKTRNLRRDARADLCVFGDGFFGDWIYVSGEAELVSLPEAMDGLVEYYRRTAGEHSDWDDYRESMRREQRLLIRVSPERVGPNRAG